MNCLPMTETRLKKCLPIMVMPHIETICYFDYKKERDGAV